jgi:hypothetical protein
MFDKNLNAIQSLYEISNMELLGDLIHQINKDLSLSGIDYQFDLEMGPDLLVGQMKLILADLMESHFQKFLSFLYRIDISEEKLRSIDSSDFEHVTNMITLLILKRQWQKVWFRNRNSQLE